MSRDKSGAMRMNPARWAFRDEMLILIRGDVCGQHDAFPCLSNQICRHLGSRLGGQLLPHHLLGLIRMRENPLGEFTVGLCKPFG